MAYISYMALSPSTVTVGGTVTATIYLKNIDMTYSVKVTWSGAASSSYTWTVLKGTTSVTDSVTTTSKGTLTCTVELKSNTFVIDTESATATVNPIYVSVPSVSGTSKTYNGGSQSPSITRDTSYTSISGTTSAKNAGDYSFTISLDDTSTQEWSGGGTDSKSYSWSISKLSLSKPYLGIWDKTYNGSYQSPTVYNYNSAYMTQSGTTWEIDANTRYDVYWTLDDTNNTQWSDGTTGKVNDWWRINKGRKAVTVPTIVNNQSFTYDGKSHSPDTSGKYDSTCCQLGGTTSTSAIGSYTLTCSLKSDKNWNYYWNESGSPSGAKSYSWSITQAPLSISSWSNDTHTYDGNPKSLSGTLSGSIVSGESVSLTYSNNSRTIPGSQTVTASLTGTHASHYTLTGTVTHTLKVNKRPNSWTSSSSTEDMSIQWGTTGTARTWTAKYGTTTYTSSDTSLVALDSSTHAPLSPSSGGLGTATITVSVAEGTYDLGITTSYKVIVTKAHYTVAKPTLNSYSFTFDWSSHDITSYINKPSGCDRVDASSTLTATNAGTYYIAFKLWDGGTKYDYVWADGYSSQTRSDVSWTISQKNLSSSTVTTTSPTYTGNTVTSVPTVTLSSHTLTNGTDYTVSGNTATNRNKSSNYTVTVTGKGNFTGTKTASWNVTPATPTITITQTAMTLAVYASATRTGTTTFGTLTYSVSTADSTYLSVTSGGTVTAKAYSSTTRTVTASVAAESTYGNWTAASKSYSVNTTQINISGATVTLGPSLTYNGQAQTQTISSVVITASGASRTVTYTVTGNVQTNHSETGYTMTLTGTGNFTGTKTASWNIAKATYQVTDPTITNNQSFVYDGQDHSPVVSGKYDSTRSELSGTYGSKKPVGSYSFKCSLKSDTNYNYVWKTSGGTAAKTYSWSITTKYVTVPTVTGTSKTYNAATQNPSITRDTSNTSISGTTSAKKVGSYSFTISLPDTSNYAWNESGYPTAAKTYSWSIAVCNVSITSWSNDTHTYDGNPKSLTANQTGIVQGDDAYLSYSNNSRTIPGSQTVTVSLAGTSATNYSLIGTVTHTLKVNKRPNSWTSSSSTEDMTIEWATTGTARTWTAKYGTVTYTSSDTSIVAVDSKTHAPLSPSGGGLGTATITVEVAEGTYDLGIKTSYKVKVTQAHYRIAKPTLNSYSFTFDWSSHDIKPYINKPSGCDRTDASSTLTATNAGTYYIAFTLWADEEKYDYVWDDGYASRTRNDISWTIAKASASSASVTATSPTYTGGTVSSVPTVTLSGHTLTNGTDYAVSNNTATNRSASGYTLKVTFKGNFLTSEKTASWNVSPATPTITITQTAMSLEVYSSATRKGSSNFGTVSYYIADADKTYLSVTSGGTVTANNYSSTARPVYAYVPADTTYGNWVYAEKSYSVNTTQVNISNATVTLGASLTYNGQAQTQTVSSVTITAGGASRTVTFDVSGNVQTNHSATGYSLTVTGTGNFTGTKTASWNIGTANNGINAGSAMTIPYESGETRTVTVTYSESGSYPTFSVDDESVATVYVNPNNKFMFTVTGHVAGGGTIVRVTYPASSIGNYYSSTTTFNVSVTTATIQKPTLTENSFTFNNTNVTITNYIAGADKAHMVFSGDQIKLHTGSYSLKVVPDSNHTWDDGTTTQVSKGWTINPADPGLSFEQSPKTVTYEDANYTITGSTTYGTVKYRSSVTSVALVGLTTGTVTIARPGDTRIYAEVAADSVNGDWTSASLYYTLHVNKKVISVNFTNKTQTYTGSQLSPTIKSSNTTKKVVVLTPDDHERINAGTYTVSVDGFQDSGDADYYALPSSLPSISDFVINKATGQITWSPQLSHSFNKKNVIQYSETVAAPQNSWGTVTYSYAMPSILNFLNTEEHPRQLEIPANLAVSETPYPLQVTATDPGDQNHTSSTAVVTFLVTILAPLYGTGIRIGDGTDYETVCQAYTGESYVEDGVTKYRWVQLHAYVGDQNGSTYEWAQIS